MNPYYERDGITIYHGRAEAWDPVPVGLVLTDPPYGIGWNAQKQNLPGCAVWDDIVNDSDTAMVEWLFAEYRRWQGWDAVVFGANCWPHLVPHRGRWLCWDKRCASQVCEFIAAKKTCPECWVDWVLPSFRRQQAS